MVCKESSASGLNTDQLAGAEAMETSTGRLPRLLSADARISSPCCTRTSVTSQIYSMTQLSGLEVTVIVPDPTSEVRASRKS